MSIFKLDFVGVGAAKAGTTWLAQCLSEHPQICASKPKELNYFCMKPPWFSSPTFYKKGDSWLHSKFSHCRQKEIYGEYSVSYLVAPESPVLIKKHNPDIKIIISYRNPAESLYSLYFQAAKEYDVPSEFDDFLGSYPQLMQYGFYYTHTSRYLERFPLENIHFVIFDDICSNPGKVIEELFGFLGVESHFQPPSLSRQVNERQAPRSVWVRNFVGNTTGFFRTNPWAKKTREFFRLLGAHYVANWIYARNLQKVTFPPMGKEAKKRLQDLYADENVALGKLLGMDLSHWSE